MPKVLIRKRVEEVADLLQLTPYLDRKPASLSGGQCQRVAMGRAIVRSPAVFLFDEPLSNLDATLRTEMRHEIKKLHQQLNTTCLYVTHDQVEAMTLADRVVVLNKGVIEQVGTPSVLYQSPSSKFVASFIGHYPMNFLPATIDLSSNCVKTKYGIDLSLPKLTEGVQCGAEVVVGIRAEHMLVASTSNPGTLCARVDWVEDMGSDKLVRALTGDDKSVLTVRVPGDTNITDELFLKPIEKKANLFCKESGKRLGGWHDR